MDEIPPLIFGKKMYPLDDPCVIVWPGGNAESFANWEMLEEYWKVQDSKMNRDLFTAHVFRYDGKEWQQQPRPPLR